MDVEILKAEIAEHLPAVPKPIGNALSFHAEGCAHCDYLRRDLEPFKEPMLTEQAILEIFSEMSCLSADGWRWMLPSYLLQCLENPGGRLDSAIEFLIYNLAPTQKHEAETRERLAALHVDQLRCLVHFLEWCGEHEHWGDYCADEIAQGLAFLPTVTAR